MSHNVTRFIEYSIDSLTSSNDWFDRYEYRTRAELKKAKYQAHAKRTQVRLERLERTQNRLDNQREAHKLELR